MESCERLHEFAKAQRLPTYGANTIDSDTRSLLQRCTLIEGIGDPAAAEPSRLCRFK